MKKGDAVMDDPTLIVKGSNGNSCLNLQEFCDMDQLYKLIDNWSKCSGMYAVIVDMEGNRTSDSFGMTEFCNMIHANENAAMYMGLLNEDGQ